MASADAVFASLLGSAVGDALGLPYENLSARRAAKLLGLPDRYRLIFGRGMVSDDAEHACMMCAAVANSRGDVDQFRHDLARRLRWWLVTIPPGVGLATLKATLKLWIGVSPTKSGVWSAGNGPAMRAAVLGRLVPRDRLIEFVEASTRLTHTDPLATAGAYAVAMASCRFAEARNPSFEDVRDAITELRPRLPSAVDAFASPLMEIAASLKRHEKTTDFAKRVCRRPGRVSGFILETVPVALHAAFASGDALDAIRESIRCGGDTDSVASIAGGIVGLSDASWLEPLIEFSCDERWLHRLAVAGTEKTKAPAFPVLRRVPRNIVLLFAVIAHVIRRVLPPY